MARILIVEDDLNISKALELRLTQDGHSVLVSHDAVVGLTMATQGHADLILMDIMMPGGDGLTVAHTLGSLPEIEIPVIFITASKKPGLREEALELGAAGLFEKPFNTKLLMETVNNTLSN